MVWDASQFFLAPGPCHLSTRKLSRINVSNVSQTSYLEARGNDIVNKDVFYEAKVFLLSIFFDKQDIAEKDV